MKSRRLLPILTALALAPLSLACSSEDPSDGGSTGGASTGGATGGDPTGTGGSGTTVPADYSWENKTFYLKIPKTRWTAPGLVGEEVGDYVPPFLVNIGACSAAGCAVTLGTAINPDPEISPQPVRAQELCNPTMQVTTVTATPNTAITLGPVDFPMFIRHYLQDVAVVVNVRNMTITNFLPSPASTQPQGVFTAGVDIREIYPMFTALSDTPTADGVCDALPSFEAACEPCDDGANYCITMRGEMLRADEFAPAFQTLATAQGTDCGTTI